MINLDINGVKYSGGASGQINQLKRCPISSPPQPMAIEVEKGVSHTFRQRQKFLTSLGSFISKEENQDIYRASTRVFHESPPDIYLSVL